MKSGRRIYFRFNSLYIYCICMPFRVDTFVVPAGKFHNPKSCVCDPSFQRLLVDGSVDLGGDHALLTASCQDSHLGIGINIHIRLAINLFPPNGDYPKRVRSLTIISWSFSSAFLISSPTASSGHFKSSLHQHFFRSFFLKEFSDVNLISPESSMRERKSSLTPIS